MTNITHITAYTASLHTTQTSAKFAEPTDFSSLLDLISANDKTDKKSTCQDNCGNDLLASIQQVLFSVNTALFDIGSAALPGTGSVPSGLNADGTISVDALLNQGGPLPAFLDRVAARYELDDAHRQALRDIAVQFKDTTGSHAEIAQMADALKNAGIG